MPPNQTFDIVIPFYNGVHHVRHLVESIDQFTEGKYHVYLVNDASDEAARAVAVQAIEATAEPASYTMIDNPANLGFLGSVNRGMRAGDGEVIVLLNSDTLVTPGWLESLGQCLNSSDDIGVVCPVSNHANFTRVDLPDGCDFLTAARQIRRLSKRRYPDIGIASGFCLMARRSTFEELGFFDEIYGRGYYEESDFCMKVLERGLRVVGDDATFIFHKGWGTFGAEGRNYWMTRNRKLFEARWGAAHDYYRRRFLDEQPFKYLERALEQSQRLAITASSSAARPQEARPSKGSHADEPATWTLRPVSEWRRLAQRVRSEGGFRSKGSPSVVYILPGLGPYGGVISVIQLVNRLLLRGIHAAVATAGRVDEAVLDEPMYFRPFIFDNPAAMQQSLPRFDVVVSTRWDTVYDALVMAEQWGARTVAFLQDFELDFYPAEDPQHEAAKISLDLIDHKIVKSAWLHDRVLPYGGRVHRIPLGLNLEVFYPRTESVVPGPRRIISAARPGVSYRNLEGTLEIMAALCEARDDVLPTFYGRSFDVDLPRYDHVGPLSQEGVARNVRGSAVLLDASLFQGFGRPGLEAMASGIPGVLTNRGGINEYARDGLNCIQFDPTDVQTAVDAVQLLLDDELLRKRLTDAGIRTARHYDSELEADRTKDLFERIAQ